ncbi:MAG TPA: FAD binding domain-containing protein, partial [Candidatus Ozemobacteraceae bacterium]|nr:FAD binding domain-containing protein [Candidatus Ozemobacteraceae bacterium]
MTMAFFRPATLREASDVLLQHPRSRIVSGGSDLVVKWKNGVVNDLDGLVDIGLLKLNQIECREGVCRIGSGATMTQVASHPLVIERFPALVQAALQVGAMQIRNLATLGGNIANASPAGDTIPALYS